MSEESEENGKKSIGKILDIIRKKCLSRRHLQNYLHNPTDYAGEQYVLSNLFPEQALTRGSMAFVAAFAALRGRQIAGHLVTRLTRRNRYQLDDPPSAARSKNITQRIVKFGFDMTVSTYLGLAVFAANVDFLVVASSLASIPLVPGRSLISDGCCQDIIQQVSSINHEEVDLTTMAVLQSFARNCKLREDYECKLRKEQGIHENTPVKIPPPGVPIDFTLKENAFTHGDGEDIISDTSNAE